MGETPDMDFDHSLDDAEIQFGRGVATPLEAEQPACRTYDRIDAAVGREVFWRSPESRPAADIRCVRVAMHRAQQRPLIIRGLHVRSTKNKPKIVEQSSGTDLDSMRISDHLVLDSSAATWNESTFAEQPASLSPLDLESWSEQHFAWVLLVSVAFVSGAFAGVLGCVIRSAWKPSAP